MWVGDFFAAVFLCDVLRKHLGVLAFFFSFLFPSYPQQHSAGFGHLSFHAGSAFRRSGSQPWVASAATCSQQQLLGVSLIVGL